MAKKYLSGNIIRNTKTTLPTGDVDFDLEAYIVDVIEANGDAAIYPLEGVFVVNSTSINMDSASTVTIDSATTSVLTGATGMQVKATAGELDLSAIAANVDINAATTVTMDSATTTVITGGTGAQMVATTGDVTFTATAGDVLINAGDDIILTPTANLTFTLAAIPTHADDTAAGVGGLTAGQVYKTAAGALMIKL